MGCNSGIGVTHLAIALCNFCASKLGKRTAYIELHQRNEILPFLSGQKHTVSSKTDTGRSFFQCRGIDYYPNANEGEIPSLLNLGYSYLIFDLGSFVEADFPEFLRCDCKIVLGSLAPWKAESWKEFFSYICGSTHLWEGFRYLLQTGNTKDILHFSKMYQISGRQITQIPFIKNPLYIEKALFLFFQELLAC